MSTYVRITGCFTEHNRLILSISPFSNSSICIHSAGAVCLWCEQCGSGGGGRRKDLLFCLSKWGHICKELPPTPLASILKVFFSHKENCYGQFISTVLKCWREC